MSSQQRARLPPTPGSNVNPTSTSASSLRYQNIDVQNNTISALSTATDTFTTNSQIYNNNNDDTLNALGPDLALSTSQVLDSLTDHERSIILDVLSRDESVRQRDAARIMWVDKHLNAFSVDILPSFYFWSKVMSVLITKFESKQFSRLKSYASSF